ncbi:MAG: hypothetical protein KIB49_00545 [Clostridiales bacterium]|nr:hypothetical protein [Clostridiales bacterium]
MRKVAISIFLAIMMMLGAVITPPSAFALTKDGSNPTQEDFSIEEIDGQIYKAIDFEDAARKDTNLFKFFSTQSLRGLGGAYPTSTSTTKPNVEDYYVNVDIDDAFFSKEQLGFDIKLYVQDRVSKKIIGVTEEITGTGKYYFKKTRNWDNTKTYDISEWQMIFRPDLTYDIRINYQEGGTFKSNSVTFDIAPLATSIYKAEYFTTGNKRPKVTAKRNNLFLEPLEIPLNKENLGKDEYYAFKAKETADGKAYYKGKQINILRFGGDGVMSLTFSNEGTAVRYKCYIVDPDASDPNDEKNLKRGPGNFTQDGTTYHYLVTGDYNNPHIFTFREELQVKFDPNGGKWTGAASGKETEVKSYPIGHSMKLNEAWGDIAKVEAPAASAITPPEVKQNNQTVENKFLGWNTDSKASTALSETDLNNLQFTEPETTLYAIYSQQNDGKAKVDYIDNATGKSITVGENDKIAGQTYPTEKEGAVNTAIPANVFDKDSAPKILGYKFNRVELQPTDGTYTAAGTNTIKIYYDKVADIVPGTDPGTNKPNEKPDGYVTVKFEPGTNGTLTGETTFYVNPKVGKTNADITEPTIKANTGFKVADPKWDPKFESTTAIDKDATYTAQYTKVDDVVNGHDENGNVVPKPDGYKTVTFDLDGKGTTTNETVFYVNPEKEVILTAPTVTGKGDYKVKTGAEAWKPEFTGTATKYAEDKTFVAQYTFDKDVVPQKPGEEKPVVPNNYVKVEFKKGDHGVISSEETTIYWVDPSKEVTVKAPAVIADKDYKHIGWDKALTAKFAEATDITALYKKLVVPGPDQPTKPDPNNPGGTIPDPDYVKVEFLPGEHGTFEKVGQLEQTTIFWVYKDEKVNFNPPTVTEKANYKFVGWDKEVKDSFNANETYTATYKEKVLTKEPTDKTDYVVVEFKAGLNGKFEQVDVVVEGGQTQKKDQTTKFWVLKNEKVTLNVPQVTPNEGYSFTGWKEPVKETYTVDTIHTAQYTNSVSDKKIEGWTELTFNQGDHGKLANGAKNVKWVDPKVALKLSDIAPGIVADTNYSFKTWTKPGEGANAQAVEVALDSVAKYDKPVAFTATYKANVIDNENEIPGNDKENFVKITFDKGDHGKFVSGDGKAITAEVSTNVRKNTEVDLTEKAPKVLPDSGYGHTGWKIGQDAINLAKVKVDAATIITATYIKGEFDENNINDILVLGPKKAAYAEGDKLDLTGLTILAIDKNGIRNEYTVSQDNKLKATDGKELTEVTLKVGETTIDLANLPKLTHKAHNDKPITLTKGNITKDSKVHLTVSMTKTNQPTDLVAANQGENPTETKIKGKAQKGDTVKIYVPGQKDPIATVEVTNDDGTFETSVSKENKPYDVGTKFNVTATAVDKEESSPQEVKVIKDVNGDWKDDDAADQKTATPSAKALNVGKDPKVTTITGKAEANAKVVAKVGDTVVGEATADNNGDYTIEATKTGKADGGALNKDTEVKVTAQVDKKLVSDPTATVVKIDKDGNKTADEDEQTPEPTVTARNIGTDGPDGKKVPATKTTVEIETVPKAKVTIEYTDKDGQPQKIENLTAGEDGKLTQEITPKLAPDTEVKVTVQDGEKKPTDKTVKVFEDLDNNKIPDTQAGQTERPAAIASNKGKTPTFTTIAGKTEPGAVITVKVKDGNEEKVVDVKEFKIDTDGNYTLQATVDSKPLKNGAEILVYAENAPKKISNPQTTTVFNDFNEDGKPDGGKVDLNDVKEIQVIAPKKMSYTQGEKLDGTGLKAVITDNKGGIEIFDYDNAKGVFKDADGKEVADITATVAGKAIKGLELTEKDHDGKAIDVKAGKMTGSTNQKLEVKQLQTPTPTIVFAANQNTVGSTGQATLTPKQKTTVKFTVVNKPTTVYVKYTVNGETKEESFDIGANDELTKTVDLAVKLPVGAEVQVLAKDADKTLSKPATANVVRDVNNDGTADDKTPLGKTKIDPIKAGSEKITVTPPEGATELVISETDRSGDTPQGSTTITVKKDANGNWKIGDTLVDKDGDKLVIPTKDKLKLDEYNVVEAEAKGDPDTRTPSIARETVGEAADKTAPAKPVVDPPIAGDENVKVKTPTEPDAKTITVVITKPGVPDKTIVVTKGDDGKWKTPDGKEVPEENGKLVVPVTPKLDKGDTVTVTTTDDSNNPSVPNEQTVVERQQLPKPTINPIKTGEKIVAGKAEKAATVDIYKKNAQDGFDLVAKDVGVSPDGSYTFNNADGFKDGDVIKVVAKKPGMIDNQEFATVGVDTSGLDKAIKDGKDALDPEKGGKNNGTPADEKLKEAIKEGEDLKKRDPAPTQKELDDAKDKIEKAIEEKKETDKALDELKKAKDELDKTIDDAEKDEKPEESIEKGQDASDTAGTVIDNKGKDADGKDMTSEQIKELVEKTKEENRLLRLPVIQVAINTAINDGQSVVFNTNPGRCKATVTILRSDKGKEVYEVETGPGGTGSITLEKALKSGDSVMVKATRITEDRPIPDYLDNYTSKGV